MLVVFQYCTVVLIAFRLVIYINRNLLAPSKAAYSHNKSYSKKIGHFWTRVMVLIHREEIGNFSAKNEGNLQKNAGVQRRPGKKK